MVLDSLNIGTHCYTSICVRSEYQNVYIHEGGIRFLKRCLEYFGVVFWADQGKILKLRKARQHLQ